VNDCAHALSGGSKPRVYTRGSGGPLAWVLLAAVCVGSAVAGRLCYLGRPFDSDAAMFAYMGRLVAEGGRVGPDLVDNKYPTVGLVMTAAWRACGTSWAAYVVLGAALSMLAAGAIAVAARRAGGSAAATGAFAVVFLNLTPAVFGGFQLETPIVCLTSLAAACAVRAVVAESLGAAAAAGMAAGCAMLLKPTAVGVLGAMAVGLAVRAMATRAPAGRPLKGMAIATVAGLAVPLAAAALYLSAAALWGELPTTTRRLSAYAGGSVVDAVSFLKVATVVVLLGFPAWVQGRRIEPRRREGAKADAKEVERVGRCGPRAATIKPRMYIRGFDGVMRPSDAATPHVPLSASRRPSRLRDFAVQSPPDHQSTAPAVVAFAVAWLLVELAAVVAQRRMYAYHFLPVVPPAALLFGLLPRRASALRLLAALGPAAALSLACAAHVVATPTDDRLAVGRYLSARAAPGDRVWADDWPRLMLETGLRPGSRQALTFLFANADDTAFADSAQIVADLSSRRPAFVVLPADLPRWLDRQTSGIVELAQHPARAAAYAAGWRRIERYTLAHYGREAVVDRVAVYRRVDEEPPDVASVRDR
jgi:hypothetical protein